MAKDAKGTKKKFDKQRFRHVIFFLLNVGLETVGFVLVSMNVFSFCVMGGEVLLQVINYLLFMPAVLISDIVFIMAIIRSKLIGNDPFTVMANFVTGVICLIAGIPVILIVLFLCGNPAQILMIGGGILTAASGAIHILNGLISYKKLPKEERTFPSRKICKRYGLS